MSGARLVESAGMRRVIRAALTGAVLALGVSLAGCAKPLFSPEDERSPFDRFDTVRNQFAPQYIEDEFGAKKPNIRARLAPKG